MVTQHLRLEFVANAGDFSQTMDIFQDHARGERGYRGANVPTVHGAQLRFAIGQLDRRGFVGELRRQHMVMHVDTPILWCVAAHRFSLAAEAIG